jgi:hypothetical protein
MFNYISLIPNEFYFFLFRCHLGGMMYDLWESLLLESELESQVNRKRKKKPRRIFDNYYLLNSL